MDADPLRVLDISPEDDRIKDLSPEDARAHFAEIGASEAFSHSDEGSPHAFMHRLELELAAELPSLHCQPPVPKTPISVPAEPAAAQDQS